MKAMNRIRERFKRNATLVSIYQKIVGYNAGEKQWCRVVMDRSTEAMIRDLNFSDFAVLEISGSKWEKFGFCKYNNKFYPDFDISKDTLSEKFDLIIAEQVFEHLKQPYKAGVNVYNMLREGGCFLITTPFLIKIHPSPHDCTRWSSTGLKYFLGECGFDINKIISYSWGNQSCVKANFKDWMPYNARRHSLKNEEDFPIVVWALAHK